MGTLVLVLGFTVAGWDGGASAGWERSNATMGVARGLPISASRLPNTPGAGRVSPMPRFKYFRAVFMGVVVVAVVAAAVRAFSESSRRDPVCNGIRLSDILHDQKLWGLDLGGRIHTAYGLQFILPPREAELMRAFHRMGEDAWPILLLELQVKDSAIASALRKYAWIPRFITNSPPSDTRNQIATLAIEELIRLPGERTSIQDRTWRGIEEFPASFRLQVALDLAGMLRTHLHDTNLAIRVCAMLRHIGTNAKPAIPALEKAASAGITGAREALERARAGD